MIMQRPSGLLVSSHVPDRMTIQPRRLRLTLRRRTNGRVRSVMCDNENVGAYRIAADQQGWDVVREEVV